MERIKLLPIGATFRDNTLGWFRVVGYTKDAYGRTVEDIDSCAEPTKEEKEAQKEASSPAAALICSKVATPEALIPKQCESKPAHVSSFWTPTLPQFEPITMDEAVAIGKAAAAIATGVVLGPLAGIGAFIGLAMMGGSEQKKKTAPSNTKRRRKKK